MANLYENIEKLCKQRGVNVTTMCKESGASRGSLTDLKSGRKQTLKYETLAKIASYFGTSVDALVSGEKKEKPNTLDGVGLGALLKECEGLSKEELEEAREILDRLDADKLNAALLMLRGLSGKQ